MTDWEHSKENEGPWPRKTHGQLVVPPGTEMGLIIETLGVLIDLDYKVKGEEVEPAWN